MVRSNVRGPAIGIYVVMVRKHMADLLLPTIEKDVKEAVRKLEGLAISLGFFSDYV